MALPTIAAALAIAVTAPIVAEQVSAQPVRRDHRDDARLRAELDQVRTELAHYQAAYTELAAGLDQVERLNLRNRDRRLKSQISRAITGAERKAAQHVQPWSYEQEQPGWRDRDDWRHVRDRRTDPRAPSLPTPYAMADRDFRALADQIGRAAFADDKLGLVRTAAQTNHFTVAQVIALMQLASFDDTRVEIAATCAPRVTDGENWFQVYGALSFSSSREALRERLGGR
ncbi:MAG: DUF4476 domain-containing protein [Deltaproteobacteria bacterium]|nr:DUF4476 domain-containing protein [Kofleriaceae bacterium]